jgi:hypothetical protein
VASTCHVKRCRYKGEPFIGIRDTAKHSRRTTFDLCHEHWLMVADLDGSMSDQIRAFCENPPAKKKPRKKRG